MYNGIANILEILKGIDLNNKEKKQVLETQLSATCIRVVVCSKNNYLS